MLQVTQRARRRCQSSSASYKGEEDHGQRGNDDADEEQSLTLGMDVDNILGRTIRRVSNAVAPNPLSAPKDDHPCQGQWEVLRA